MAINLICFEIAPPAGGMHRSRPLQYFYLTIVRQHVAVPLSLNTIYLCVSYTYAIVQKSNRKTLHI